MMKKWTIRILAALAFLYITAGFFVLPYLIRTQVPPIVAEKTGGSLQIGGAAFNPLILQLVLEDVRLATPDGAPLFALRRFDADLSMLRLLTGRIVVEHVGVYAPRLFVVQESDGVFNFAALVPKTDAAPETTPEPEANATVLPPLRLKELVIEDGSVDFIDRSRPEPLHLQIEPIGLHLDDIDLGGSGANRIHFYAGTGSGGLLDVKSSVRSFAPLALGGRVDYDAGKLYLAYHFLQNVSDLEVADGRLHAALTFDMNLSDLNATVLDDINVTLARLRIVPKTAHGDVLRIGSMHLGAGPVYPLRQQAKVEEIRFDNLFVAATRMKDGTLDWQHFFPAKAEAKEATEGNRTAETAAPWDVHLDTFAVTDLDVRFEDATLPKPAVLSVDDFNLTVTGISTDLTKPLPFESRFSLNRDGVIESNGTVTPKPTAAAVTYAVRKLGLTPFDPYVEAMSYARLERGNVDVEGKVRYAPSERAADLSAGGDFGLGDLLVTDSRDAMPLLSVGKFEAKAWLFELAPNRLFVDTARMDAFYTNIMVDRNKTLNLATLMKEDAAAEPKAEETTKPAKPAEAFPVRIVRFIVENGAMHFADASLPLPFDTHIHDVNGEVLGISSLPDDTTYLKMAGEIDKYGVAKADGSLNTANPKDFTDIGVAFRNIELSSYTPYSGKFIGRAIDQGKLSVTLRYKIVEGKMQGDNGLVINRIELGRDIESADAVSLPLEFAIALLEDSDGVIDIDMPVAGDVDNPEFKWGGVVWNAFVNLLTKAVTAPFALIGSMLGIDGEELKAVPFEPGSAQVDAVARERLDQLAKALVKRPKLGVTVTGTFDNTVDTTALKRRALVKQVLGTEAKEDIDARTALVPALLEPLYEERLGEGALETLRNRVDAMEDADEAEKTRAYRSELFETMVETQPLAADATTKLAQRRADAIRSYLAVNHGVEGGRVAEEAPEAAEAADGYIDTVLGLDAAK